MGHFDIGAPPSAGRSTETRAIIMPVLERERDMTAHARNRGDHAQEISGLSPAPSTGTHGSSARRFLSAIDIQSASSTICFRPEKFAIAKYRPVASILGAHRSSRSGLTSGHEEPRLEATIVAAKPASGPNLRAPRATESKPLVGYRRHCASASGPRRAGELRSGRAGTRVGRVRGRNDDPALRLAHGAHAASCSSRTVGSVNRRVDPGRMGSAPNEKQVLRNRLDETIARGRRCVDALRTREAYYDRTQGGDNDHLTTSYGRCTRRRGFACARGCASGARPAGQHRSDSVGGERLDRRTCHDQHRR